MNKVVLITGCSRGIGYGLVQQYAARSDYLVIATCRDPSKAQDLQELSKTSVARIEIVPMDVADEKSIQKAVEEVKKLTSKIDILINNAGMMAKNRNQPMLKFPKEEIMKSFETNVVGMVQVTSAFYYFLKNSHRKDEDGSLSTKISGALKRIQTVVGHLHQDQPLVINMSSNLGSITNCIEGEDGRSGPYRLTKSAINMLTAVLSKENPDITFVSIHPGWVETDMGRAGGGTPEISLETSTSGIVKVIDGLSSRDTAKFYDYAGRTLPW